MSSTRKLSQEQQTQVALASLCGIYQASLTPGYIEQRWEISHSTINNIVRKYSRDWNDPLVELYRLTPYLDKVKNAIHLKHTFENQGDGFPEVNLIDKERDKDAYEAVNESIFIPRTEKLIGETGLDRILGATERHVSGEEDLLQAVFGYLTPVDGYQQALKFVTPSIHQRLREAYFQQGRLSIGAIYAQVTDDMFKKLSLGLSLAKIADVVEYARYLEGKEPQELSDKIQAFLQGLDETQYRILNLSYGLKGQDRKTPAEIAEDFPFGEDEVREIEAQVLSSLRDSNRDGYTELKSLYERMEDNLPKTNLISMEPERPTEVVNGHPITPDIINETKLERIFEATERRLSRGEYLLQDVFAAYKPFDSHQQATKLVSQFIGQRQGELYPQGQSTNAEEVHGQVTDDIFTMLRLGLSLAGNAEIVGYAGQRRRNDIQKLSDEIKEILSELPDAQQETIIIKYLEDDYPKKDTRIAEIIHRSPTAVKQRLGKAFYRLGRDPRVPGLIGLIRDQ